MFKSVFAKYISAFFLIILISFLVISATITSIVSNYSRDTKVNIMETAATTASMYIENKMSDLDTRNIYEAVALNDEDINDMFSVILSAANDLTIILTDNDGRILIVTGPEKDQIRRNNVLPRSFVDRIEHGTEVFHVKKDAEFFNSDHLIYGLPVISDTSESYGHIFVCSSSVIMADLIQRITKAIIMSVLWIMMAALIAVYFITEKIVGPLKKISIAARQFASGKFDTRVPVSGSDEVAELATAFNNMAQSLDNYDNMRNTFISNVSHDLRTPMTSISGFVDGILDGVIPPEKQEYYLRIVSSEVKRLSRLVASLLDLSRIQAGERKFNMTSFDICEMARHIIISFDQTLSEKQLEVEFICDDDNMNVIADRDAIYQTLYNLCENAVKFSREGGLFKITIKKIKGKKLLVSVYNEGQGIPPADLPYVFERFYKSDKSRGLNKSGVGLGLYISKTIIEAHNEHIWVESEFEQNCCFSFTLSSE